jgi:NTE family protein
VPRPLATLPDVLVLGAGGTLGIAWLRGMATGIEEGAGLDLRRCDYFVGTSAGAYVAAHLAAGERVEDPGVVHDIAAEPDAALTEDVPGAFRRAAGGGLKVAAAATAPLMPLALRATRAPGELARAAILRTARGERREVDLGSYIKKLGSFDGRLRVTAVDRATGGRILFGAPGAPRASVAEAVLASCSVPWVFAPVEIDGREYVDGGVWSMSNLDAAPAGRQSEVLALLPTFGRGSGRGAAALLRAAGQAAGLAELQLLRSRGIRCRIIAPDAPTIEAMGGDLLARGPIPAVYAAGRAQGRKLATES